MLSRLITSGGFDANRETVWWILPITYHHFLKTLDCQPRQGTRQMLFAKINRYKQK